MLEFEMRQTVGLLERGIQSGKETQIDEDLLGNDLYDHLLYQAIGGSKDNLQFFLQRETQD